MPFFSCPVVRWPLETGIFQCCCLTSDGGKRLLSTRKDTFDNGGQKRNKPRLTSGKKQFERALSEPQLPVCKKASLLDSSMAHSCGLAACMHHNSSLDSEHSPLHAALLVPLSLPL